MLLSVCIVAGFILYDKYGYRKRCFCEGCYMDIDTIVAELTRRFDALRYEVWWSSPRSCGARCRGRLCLQHERFVIDIAGAAEEFDS